MNLHAPLAVRRALARAAAHHVTCTFVFTVVCIVTCLAATPRRALAQSSSVAATDGQVLNPVVVTAARVEQALLDTLPATTVINARTIRESGARDLLSLLRTQAGIDVVQAGGPGNLPNVFLRGASLNQVAVLVDGVRVDSLSSGLPALQTLAIDNIERVEIARGNLSSLYGSGAIGGVIQIFTGHARAGPGVHFVPQFKIEAGQHRQSSLSASLDGHADALDLSVGAARQASGGFSSVNVAQAPSANPDDDRYTRRSGHLNLGYALNASNNVRVVASTQRGRVQYDDASGFGTPTGIQYSDFETTTAALTTHHALARGITLNLALDQSDDRARDTSIDSYSYASYVNTRSQHGEAGVTFAWDATRIMGAAERTQTRLGSDTSFDKTRRNIDTLRAGVVGSTEQHEWQANARTDHYSDFGQRTTGYLGYGLRLGDQWRLLGSGSTGFRAPTFNDLYYPFGFGNPKLKPETSRNVELGASWQGSAGHARVTAFRTGYRELIMLDGNFMPGNIGSATVKGLELITAWQIAGLDIEFNAARMNAVSDATGMQLPRRARTHASASISQQLGPWSWRAQAQATGSRLDDASGTRSLDAFEVFDLALARQLCTHWTVRLRVDNIAGKRYQTVYAYDQPARQFWLALEYRPR